jgi:hypothetical protein
MATNDWYTILGPNDWNGLKLETGNRQIDTTYKNIISSQYSCLVAPTTLYMVGGSGIELITPGFVDASGIRVKELRAANIRSVDVSGNPIPRYIGPSGGLIYKETDDTHAVDSNIIINSGEITIPTLSASNALWIDPSGNKLKSFPEIVLEPQQIIPAEEPGGEPTIIPAKVYVSGQDADFICENIQIGRPFPAYRGSVLTHTGADGRAVWTPANYLEAEGALFNRYPKRTCYIFGRAPNSNANSTAMITLSSPPWAGLGLKASGSPDSLDGDNIGSLDFHKEFGFSDTVAIIKATTREVSYVKFASTVSYLSSDSFDVETDVIELDPPQTSFKDSLGNEVNVLNVDICGTVTADGNDQNQQDTDLGTKPGYDQGSNEGLDGFYVSDVSGVPDGAYYIYSVTRGAYLSMGLDPNATSPFRCAASGNDEYTFKPSTQNQLSIRPNISTAFNTLAEDIDFAIYGKVNVEHNNYASGLFDKDESLLPSGMMPALFIDAYIPDSVQGTTQSGVIFNQWLDRDKTIPSGYTFKHDPFTCINTYSPYIIDSITNSGNFDIPLYQLPPGKTPADYNTLNLYASLTIKGATYSDEIITSGVYLRPKPSIDNEGEYIANSLLTLNRDGKITPRIPTPNPTAPGLASDIRVLINGNSSASINWSHAYSGGKDILYYYLEFSLDGGETWTEFDEQYIDRPLDNVNYATINNLIPNVDYIFAVTAQNSIGVGDRAVSASGDPSATFNSNLNLPSTIYNLSGVRYFADSINTSTTSYVTLSWKPPVSNGTSDIQGYLIEESDDKGQTWIYYNTTDNLIDDNYIVDINGSEWYQESIYGLTNQNNYTYRVSAINNNGQGTYAYVYLSGTIPPELEQEAIEKRQQEEEEVLSNWDFGDILFTGVCQA